MEMSDATLKLKLTQFFLALTLFSNPIVGLAVTVSDVFDTESSVVSQMPCDIAMRQSQLTEHDTHGDIDGEQANSMDCCADGDCSMGQSCQSCLNLHVVNVMLLETFVFCLANTLQRKLETADSYFPDRPILPEIQPPDSFNHS